MHPEVLARLSDALGDQVKPAALLRALSIIEDHTCKIIAERALACTAEADKKALRGNWRLANNRADVFMQMAMEAENAAS